MARIAFLDNFNGQAMANVQANIKEVTVVKPIDASISNKFYDINGSAYQPTRPNPEEGGDPIPITEQLLGINGTGVAFAVSSDYLKGMLPDSLTVNNLTVNDITTLGTGDASDKIYLRGEVIGLAVPNASYTNINAPTVSINFDTVTANHFIGGDFVGTTVSATIGKFTTLEVGGQPYQPFFTADTFAADFDPYRLWIDIGNENVPIIKYCIDAANANVSTNWVALGAVFG